jgi:molybdate transport system regulatory protein
MTKKKISPAFKLWFQIGEDYVFGEGAYELLEQIRERKSISAAARAARMSYRYAWAHIKEIEEHLGESIVRTQKGGERGGKTEITKEGLSLLTRYKRLKELMTEVCKEETARK